MDEQETVWSRCENGRITDEVNATWKPKTRAATRRMEYRHCSYRGGYTFGEKKRKKTMPERNMQE